LDFRSSSPIKSPLKNSSQGIDKNPVAVRAYDFNIKVDGISCGIDHTAYLSNGVVFVTGENFDGQLGIGKRNIRTATKPYPVTSLQKYFK